MCIFYLSSANSDEITGVVTQIGKSLELQSYCEEKYEKRKMMEGKKENIDFETEDGEKISLYVVEQTMLAGTNYLLVAESQEEEAQAYIMREITDDDNQKIYEMVEDDSELESLSKIFEELLDDVDIEM